ncbi:MAG: hypothetical protein IEMM0008_0121 [bacterium]|nr:MAG: hypothetical protein IEMM0008_0121 [bacterium]
MFDLLQFKEHLNEKGIMMAYAGPVTHGIVEGMAEVVKHKLKLESTPVITKKVFSIFIEGIQNIMNHSVEKKEVGSNMEFKSGITVMGKEEKENKYYVMTGNLIENKQKGQLISHLEKIKSLDKEELKKLYKEQIKKDLDLESQTAGLGFIDIARKASEPLEYTIQDVDDLYSFFFIKVIVY